VLELSLVIPAFNESSRLAAGFERLQPLFDVVDASSIEVIVIDDGSSDDTMQRAHDVYGHLEHTRYVQQPANLGKGAALRLGMGLASGANVITTDADMAIDPKQIPLFMTSLRDSAVVPGSRAIKGHINYDAQLRTWAGDVFSRLVRHYTKITQRDTQCGCKGFQLGAARLLALLALIDGFAFDVELFYLADRLGLSVRPLLVTWQDVGGSSVRPGRDARVMLRDIKSIARTRYENPVVSLDAAVSVEAIASYAAQARLHGLVLARGESDSLLVVGRNDALGAAGIAAGLKGTLRTANIDELRGRTYEAV
jgi:dolichyl-phosphate beta-glucosyltransferase